MQPAQDRPRDDPALANPIVIRRPLGDPLTESLMGSAVVEILEGIFAHDAFEALGTRDEHVLEALAAGTPDKSLTNGVHVGMKAVEDLATAALGKVGVCAAKRFISIANEVLRRRVEIERRIALL